MTRTIAISTNKGGVLKTSITVNLAGILAKEGHKVLIIDADNQGNVSLSFGKNPDSFKNTLYSVLLEGLPAKEVIKTVYEWHEPTLKEYMKRLSIKRMQDYNRTLKALKNIDILPSNDDMTFFEFDVLPNMVKYKRPFHLLKEQIQAIQANYDYVLIDTPPNLGLTQGNVLASSDEVLIPFQPESYSMRSLVKIMQAIESFKKDHNPNLEILGVVATLVDSRTSLHSEILSECRLFCKEKGIHMLDAVIPRRIRYATSIAYEGLPATLTATRNDLVKSYYDLKGEICND